MRAFSRATIHKYVPILFFQWFHFSRQQVWNICRYIGVEIQECRRWNSNWKIPKRISIMQSHRKMFTSKLYGSVEYVRCQFDVYDFEIIVWIRESVQFTIWMRKLIFWYSSLLIPFSNCFFRKITRSEGQFLQNCSISNYYHTGD